MSSSPEEDLFDRIAKLIPEDFRESYLRHVTAIRRFHPDDEILGIVEACGWFSLIAAQVPKEIEEQLNQIREELADKIASGAAEKFCKTVQAEFDTGNLRQVNETLAATRKLVDQFTSKTIHVVDSSAVAVRLDKFRTNSFRAVAIAAVAGVVLCLLGFGFGIYVRFRQQADKQLESLLANDIPQQRVVMEALLRRGVTMQLYNTHNPWTKADCQAVVFGGPVGSVFTDEEGHGVVLLPH